MDEQRRLELARRAELSSRPVTAEIYISPIMYFATLRLLSAAGSSQERYMFSLAGLWTEGHGETLQRIAEQHMPSDEFTLAGPWHPHGVDKVRAPLHPTAAYLAHIERRYGPEPDVAALLPLGWEVTRRQRGLWKVTNGADAWHVSWRTTVHGEHWSLWDRTDRKRLGTYASTDALIDALTDESLSARWGAE